MGRGARREKEEEGEGEEEERRGRGGGKGEGGRARLLGVYLANPAGQPMSFLTFFTLLFSLYFHVLKILLGMTQLQPETAGPTPTPERKGQPPTPKREGEGGKIFVAPKTFEFLSLNSLESRYYRTPKCLKLNILIPFQIISIIIMIVIVIMMNIIL